MDRDTAVARIQEKLGFRTDLVLNIQNALQDAQDELERGTTMPPWLWSQDTPFTLTPTGPPSAMPLEVVLPANFIRESAEQDGNLYYRLTGSFQPIFLQKMDFRKAEEFFFDRRQVWWDGTMTTVQSASANPTPGAPVAYVLRQNTARFYPGPDVVYHLLWTYYKHDSGLNGSNVGDGTGTPNGWLTNAPWLLIGEAGLLMSTSLRDGDAMQVFQQILDGTTGTRGARRDYLAWVYERESAGINYRMGEQL